jgi:signal transduction histidine kinase
VSNETENSSEILGQAFQQFTLESERIETSFQNVSHRFLEIQKNIEESNTKFSGKIAELGFLTRYLEAILNHLTQGILFINLNGIVTTCNAAAEEILGVAASRLLFHPFNDFFQDNCFGFSLREAFHLRKCPKGLSLSWSPSNEKKLELEIEATFVEMEEQAVPLDQRQRERGAAPIQGLLILIRNVTEMHYLQQVAGRNDRLKELGEMAAHLAHEIRNPLGGIKGYASLLEQDLKERPDLQHMATSIVEGTNTLNLLVSNILTYTRPFQPHFETVELVPFINEIKNLLQADSTWNPTYTFELHHRDESIKVAADPQLLQSALLNLFVNAMQAMPQGGLISVHLHRDWNHAILTISDTGKGISKENLDKIFSPFFTTKQTGTGLGLSEVHKVIQSHMGTIEVHSQEGKGTSFIIKIPLKNGMRSREYVH